MKPMFQIIFCVALCTLMSQHVSAQSNLKVNIKNIKNDRGDILVGLYDKASGFPRHVKDGKVIKARGNEMTVTFSDIQPGSYAVSVLHDENQNKDLDQNRIGKPKEGFGFSNNAMGIIGPPSFKRARITVPDSKDTDITINMKYYQ